MWSLISINTLITHIEVIASLSFNNDYYYRHESSNAIGRFFSTLIFINFKLTESILVIHKRYKRKRAN
jgi:hypothetical protein